MSNMSLITVGRASIKRNINSKHAAAVLCNNHTPSIGIIPDDLPEEIRNLSASFPLAWSMCNSNSSAQSEVTAANIIQRIRAFLPPRDEATLLCRIVRENLLWQSVTTLSCRVLTFNSLLQAELHYVGESQRVPYI